MLSWTDSCAHCKLSIPSVGLFLTATFYRNNFLLSFNPFCFHFSMSTLCLSIILSTIKSQSNKTSFIAFITMRLTIVFFKTYQYIWFELCHCMRGFEKKKTGVNWMVIKNLFSKKCFMFHVYISKQRYYWTVVHHLINHKSQAMISFDKEQT